MYVYMRVCGSVYVNVCVRACVFCGGAVGESESVILVNSLASVATVQFQHLPNISHLGITFNIFCF